jgi:hypothetical protein
LKYDDLQWDETFKKQFICTVPIARIITPILRADQCMACLRTARR